MANRRSKAREYALLSLFPQFLEGSNASDSLEYLFDERKPGEAVREFARELLEGVLEHQVSLDERIASSLDTWPFERLGNIEKTILRIAVYELMHCPATPPSAILNEAVSLSEEYATPDSTRFVNGVLANIARKERGEEDEES
jgi:transcription antitermination protein NusB